VEKEPKALGINLTRASKSQTALAAVDSRESVTVLRQYGGFHVKSHVVLLRSEIREPRIAEHPVLDDLFSVRRDLEDHVANGSQHFTLLSRYIIPISLR
jgi:hypothetical protein